MHMPLRLNTAEKRLRAANLRPPERAGIVTFISFISTRLSQETFSDVGVFYQKSADRAYIFSLLCARGTDLSAPKTC